MKFNTLMILRAAGDNLPSLELVDRLFHRYHMRLRAEGLEHEAVDALPSSKVAGFHWIFLVIDVKPGARSLRDERGVTKWLPVGISREEASASVDVIPLLSYEALWKVGVPEGELKWSVVRYPPNPQRENGINHRLTVTHVPSGTEAYGGHHPDIEGNKLMAYRHLVSRLVHGSFEKPNAYSKLAPATASGQVVEK